MSKFSVTILVVLAFISCKKKSNAPAFACKGGVADIQYPCDDIHLLAVVKPQELQGLESTDSPTVCLNDIWGWTDPMTKKEYALVGLTNGVSFVDVSNPEKPIVIGKLDESSLNPKSKSYNLSGYDACAIGIGDSEGAKNLTEGSTWRDIKIYNDHAFIVKDYSRNKREPHGMQIFDLKNLRNFSNEFLNFREEMIYDEIYNSHNIIINERTGYGYAVGVFDADTCDTGGLHIIDIKDPKSPTFAGCYEDTTPPRRRSNSAYIHDAQCVNYVGPDSDYTGKEVCFSAAERSLVIADVTDKADVTTVGFASSPSMSYAHQGWLTEDHKYFLMNDELDEFNLGRTTKTYIFDVSDLSNPTFVNFYEHNTESIDHNLYIKGDYVYASNYVSGLRVMRMNDISSAELEEVAFFDSEPNIYSNPNQQFNGTWSNYPFFESGVIIMSDINRGLFILQPDFN